jgi:hypothetical protein
VVLGERLLDRVRQGVGLVAGVDQLARPLILVCVTLSFLHQAIDVLFAEPARRGDRDPLFLPRRKIRGGDVDDAVGIDVEGDLDLRNASGGRRDAYAPAPCTETYRESSLAPSDSAGWSATLTTRRRPRSVRLSSPNRNPAASHPP